MLKDFAPNYPGCASAHRSEFHCLRLGCPHAVRSIDVFRVYLRFHLYQWLSLQLGSVFGGLAAAAIFMVLAALGGLLTVLAQRRVRERAILERAVQMPGRMWVLDPKILSQAFRSPARWAGSASCRSRCSV